MGWRSVLGSWQDGSSLARGRNARHRPAKSAKVCLGSVFKASRIVANSRRQRSWVATTAQLFVKQQSIVDRSWNVTERVGRLAGVARTWLLASARQHWLPNRPGGCVLPHG